MATPDTAADVLTEMERQTRDFARSLNEKDRRRFVALEAKRFGHGGIGWIVRIVGCSRHTVERGMKELDSLADDPVKGRIRRPGAGRKKKSNPTQSSKTI
jgi:hypothetical protein